MAEAAFSLACSLANFSEAEIVLLRVVEYPFEIYSCGMNDSFFQNPLTDPKRAKKIHAKKDTIYRGVANYLKHLVAKEVTNHQKVTFEIREGPVVDAILDVIEKRVVNLIVISSTGQDQNPYMMGSVASRILREAQVPVILIRDESGNQIQYKSSGQRFPLEKTINKNYGVMVT